MGGSIGIVKHFYDNSVSDDEGYYSIDGIGKGIMKEELSKERENYTALHRTGLVNPTVLDVPYINRYPFNEYRFQKKLGVGKTSIVYKATNVKNEKEKYAIKEIKSSEMEKSVFEDFRYELNILSQLAHPSILRLFSVYDSTGPNPKFYLILEYLKGGELLNAIIHHQHYTELDVIHFANQMAAGMYYLHSRGVIHGNFIPENVVLSNQRFVDCNLSHIKIVGFDYAETIHSRRSHNMLLKNMIDEQFRSPELAELSQSQNVVTSREADIWGFGVFLYLLLSGGLPSSSGATPVAMNAMSSFTEAKWDKISFAAKELLCKVLLPNPKSRYTAHDVITNPWILSSSRQKTNTSSLIDGSFLLPEPEFVEDPSHRRKVVSIAKASKSVLTLNHTLPALEEFQRKRYFYLEGYRNQNSSKNSGKSSASLSPTERGTIYRFLSNDFSKDIPKSKLQALSKEFETYDRLADDLNEKPEL